MTASTRVRIPSPHPHGPLDKLVKSLAFQAGAYGFESRTDHPTSYKHTKKCMVIPPQRSNRLLNFIMIMMCALSLNAAPIESSKVQKFRTDISDQQLIEVLDRSHRRIFGEEPSKNRLAMAWAQVAFENGRGRKVFNHNLGNIGKGKGQSYYLVSGYQFRSFPSFDDGADAYWSMLLARCSGSLRWFTDGDPRGASIMLRRCGYYRADVDHYASNLTSLYFTGRRLLDASHGNMVEG